MKEAQFEKELIEYLSTGTINQGTSDSTVHDRMADYVTKTKLWTYEPSIKTTEAHCWRLYRGRHNISRRYWSSTIIKDCNVHLARLSLLK